MKPANLGDYRAGMMRGKPMLLRGKTRSSAITRYRDRLIPHSVPMALGKRD